MERLSGEVPREQIVNVCSFGISNSAIHPNCRLWGKFHHDLPAGPAWRGLVIRWTIQVNLDNIQGPKCNRGTKGVLFSAHNLLPVWMFNVYAWDQASIG